MIPPIQALGYTPPKPSPPSGYVVAVFEFFVHIFGLLILCFRIGYNAAACRYTAACACPVTILIQLRTVAKELLLIAVTILVEIYSYLFIRRWRRNGYFSGGDHEPANKTDDSKSDSIYKFRGMGAGVDLAVFEIFCLSVLGAVTWWEAKEENLMEMLTWANFQPVFGGVVVGLSQGAGLLLVGEIFNSLCSSL